MGILRSAVGAAALALLLAASAAGQQPAPRWEIGGQFVYIGLDQTFLSGGITADAVPGFGANGSVHIWRSLSATAAFSFFPQFSYPTNGYGGREDEFLAGVRYGLWRWRRLGFFAQIRPGFLSYSHVIIGRNPGPCCNFIDGRLRDFALNLGGGVTYYTSGHTALRFALGDTLLYDNDPFSRMFGATGYWRSHAQFTSALVFRF